MHLTNLSQDREDPKKRMADVLRNGQVWGTNCGLSEIFRQTSASVSLVYVSVKSQSMKVP